MPACAAFLAAILLCGLAGAQVRLHGHLVDRMGRPVAGMSIVVDGRSVSAVSDAGGAFTFDLPTLNNAGVTVQARTSTFTSSTVQVMPGEEGREIELIASASPLSQQISVTATRGPVALGPEAVTESTLTAEKLTRFPALTLDESLRQEAGFELFRRSSGWVQNPTSQGISLRGLGSTAASRSLVLANLAPLNDAFGGWVHWNELPPETIEAVVINSGGGSDLYGSSALGGVIDVVPAHPGSSLADVGVAVAGDDTRLASGRADARQGPWRELAGAEDLRTAGYILVAPEVRGPVDVPANVHFQNGRVEADRVLGAAGRAFVTGNVLNETRGNGTPVTTNGTRLWRYLAADDWTAGPRTSGRARLFGADEAYRQSFAAIAPLRTSEILTRLQRVEAQELGASADTSVHWTRIALVAGGDVRDIRARDTERPTRGLAEDTSARQRFAGGFGELVAQHGGWSGTASLRLDSAANLASRQFSGSVLTSMPYRGEIVASPRLGVVRQLTGAVAVHASAFRAFRTPTMNELYRTGQVGQEITLPNADLVSERATGIEGGAAARVRRLSAAATYFWTEVNRPVAAVLVSATATTITNMRENLGQFQSQGVEANVVWNDGGALSATAGYQYAHAVVTKFPAQTGLVGKWIPDVARESATAQLRLRDPRFGELTVAARDSGRAFDDSENNYVLRSFFELDAYAGRALGHGFSAFVSGQNLTGKRADVARTPVLTQGIPVVMQGGVRYGWGAR